ncbi:MAG: hypothetical protein V5804_14345 [Mucilaginibacter sp.]|uniref:hypothetical protein n=1 Tax=Mucilaginibacter sp. TaxID=1882438 RepID=UPI0034E58DC7
MLHTTITPNEKTISVVIPENYVGKEIEMIVFAKDEGLAKHALQKKVTFEALAIDTKGYQFNRDEANDRR